MLTDATGDFAVIEYANGAMQVIKNRYVTNFFLTPDVSTDRCGWERYGMLDKHMKETGGIFRDLSHALKPLADTAEDGTRWSALFNAATRSVDLVLEHRFDLPIYHFELDQPVW
jgi:hypothetical protein